MVVFHSGGGCRSRVPRLPFVAPHQEGCHDSFLLSQIHRAVSASAGLSAPAARPLLRRVSPITHPVCHVLWPLPNRGVASKTCPPPPPARATALCGLWSWTRGASSCSRRWWRTSATRERGRSGSVMCRRGGPSRRRPRGPKTENSETPTPFPVPPSCCGGCVCALNNIFFWWWWCCC